MLRTLTVLLLLAAPALAQERRIENNVAVFSGLDKVTGRTIEFDVWIDETVQFGVLQVTPRVCYSRPRTERPKTTSFIEVNEVTLERKMQRIFTGWVFAESPGLNALEHPVNDVWLKGCRQTSSVAAPPNFRMRDTAVQVLEDPNAPRAGEGVIDPNDPLATGEAFDAPTEPGQGMIPRDDLAEGDDPLVEGADDGVAAQDRPQTLEEFLALPDEPLQD